MHFSTPRLPSRTWRRRPRARREARCATAGGAPAAAPGAAPPPSPLPLAFLSALLPRSRPGDVPLQQRLLSLLLCTPTVPIGSYVSSPRGWAHALDARTKQAALLALMLLPGACALPGKLALAGLVALATATALPRRVARPQLLGLALLCSLLLLGGALGADSVAPVTQARSPLLPPPTASAVQLPTLLPLPPSTLSWPPLQSLLPSRYSYTLLSWGPVAVTRRGLSFGAASAATTFALLQSARLALCTTTPEALAAALAAGAGPAVRLWAALPRPSDLFAAPLFVARSHTGGGGGRAPAPPPPPPPPSRAQREDAAGEALDRALLTLLLSLRFVSHVFDAARNLALGLAARGLDWKALGPGGTLRVLARLGARGGEDLLLESAQVARAMRARGYAGPAQARAALAAAAPLAFGPADAAAAVGFAAAAAGLCALR